MSVHSYFQKIDSLRGELATLLPMAGEIQQKLDRKFRLEFQYNSNHIEGNTLTYAETELLLIFDETRGSHTSREYDEMKGSDVAYELMTELAADKERPLTESFIKNLNQVLLVKPYWKEAITADGQQTRRKIIVGDYKRQPNSVRLQNGEVFEYAAPAETPQLMGDLIDWFRSELDKKDVHVAELAALLHYKFVRIHPFDDGNGRISRLLLNYVFLYFDFPPVVIKSDDKINYLRALHNADTRNLLSFTNYIAEQLTWSLELSLKAARNESIEEVEDWKKDLHLLKRELGEKDEIKVKKSNEVLLKLINEEILPFCRRLESELSDFKELFMDSYFFYYRENKYYAFSAKLTEEMIETIENNQLKLLISYDEFFKNVENPFTITLQPIIEFEQYKYYFKFNNKTIFSNLYHQPISDAQLREAASVCGKYILALINAKKDTPS